MAQTRRPPRRILNAQEPYDEFYSKKMQPINGFNDFLDHDIKRLTEIAQGNGSSARKALSDLKRVKVIKQNLSQKMAAGNPSINQQLAQVRRDLTEQYHEHFSIFNHCQPVDVNQPVLKRDEALRIAQLGSRVDPRDRPLELPQCFLAQKSGTGRPGGSKAQQRP